MRRIKIRTLCFLFLGSVMLLHPFGITAERQFPSSEVTTARDIAMGKASLSACYDVSALFVNPAMMSEMAKSGFSSTFAYNDFYNNNGTYEGSVGFAMRVPFVDKLGRQKYLAFGLGGKTHIDEYTTYSAANAVTGTDTYADIMGVLAFSMNLGGSALGVALKPFGSVLDGEYTFGGVLDAAFTGTIILDGLRYAVVAKNLGGYYDAGDVASSVFNLDTEIYVSIGYVDIGGLFNVSLAFDYSLPANKTGFSIGGEFLVMRFSQQTNGAFPQGFLDGVQVPDGIRVRAGFNRSSPALGLGVYFGAFRLDYALSTDNFTFSGINHTVSVEVSL